MQQNESEKKLYIPINDNRSSFFVDENLPKNLWKALRAAGYPAARAVDEGLRGKHDSAIFRQVGHRSVIITRDQDFLRADLFPPPHSGIIVVKVPQNTPIADLIKIVLNALDVLTRHELANRVYVVEHNLISQYRQRSASIRVVVSLPSFPLCISFYDDSSHPVLRYSDTESSY